MDNYRRYVEQIFIMWIRRVYINTGANGQTKILDKKSQVHAHLHLRQRKSEAKWPDDHVPHPIPPLLQITAMFETNNFSFIRDISASLSDIPRSYVSSLSTEPTPVSLPTATGFSIRCRGQIKPEISQLNL